MQRIYLQFRCLADLKKFRDALPAKKVFILLQQNVLFAELSNREIDLAMEAYKAEVVSVPVA